jgi:hypothetical protein
VIRGRRFILPHIQPGAGDVLLRQRFRQRQYESRSRAAGITSRPGAVRGLGMKAGAYHKVSHRGPSAPNCEIACPEDGQTGRSSREDRVKTVAKPGIADYGSVRSIDLTVPQRRAKEKGIKTCRAWRSSEH